jgi:EmrB/QacA subfamily drug resistance transporter
VAPKGDDKRWWTLANACISVLMALLDVTIVNVALPTLQRDLHAHFEDLQWVVNAYALSLAVALVTGGRLGDMFGRRRLFAIGVGIFVAGSGLAGLSGVVHTAAFPQIDALLGARAVQGIGAAIMMPVSLAIVSNAFEGKERGIAIGTWGALAGLGLAAGPIIGGLLIVTVGWPSIFFLNIPIGLVSILASFATIDESRDERAPKRIDWPGIVSLSIFAFSLVWGLIRLDGMRGAPLFELVWPFLAAAVALALFVTIELRSDHAMVDVRLFSNRSFTGDAVAVFALSAAMVAFIFFLTLYLQNALGFDALQTGIHLLPMTVLVGICAPIAGRYVDRMGPRWIITAGLGLGAIGAFLVSRVTPADSQAQWTVLLPSFVLIGVGLGSANAPINTVAVGTADPGQAGVASGIINVCRQIGTAFGIAFLGVFLTAHYDGALAQRHLPPRITQAIRKAGPQAGSGGLQQAPPAIRHLPIFPQVSHDTRAAWIESFAMTMRVAALFIAAGAAVAAATIRKDDLRGSG